MSSSIWSGTTPLSLVISVLGRKNILKQIVCAHILSLKLSMPDLFLSVMLTYLMKDEVSTSDGCTVINVIGRLDVSFTVTVGPVMLRIAHLISSSYLSNIAHASLFISMIFLFIGVFSLMCSSKC